MNFYAASKKSNEIIATSFNEVIKAKLVGLRFFTCYGPYGRPDMAVFKFTRLIKSGKEILFHNYGKHLRDFTYVDDVINCIDLIIKNQRKLNKTEIFNIGKEKPNSLKELSNLLSLELGKKALIKKIRAQKGEVRTTRSDMNYFYKKFKYKPNTSLKKELKNLFIGIKHMNKILKYLNINKKILNLNNFFYFKFAFLFLEFLFWS